MGGREREKKRKRRREEASFKCLQESGRGREKGRSQEPISDPPSGWQAPNYLSHHLLPPSVHSSRMFLLEKEPELEPRHFHMEGRILLVS